MKIFLIVLWGLGSLAAMILVASQDIQAFDPKGRLLYASTSQDFDADVEKAFAQEFGRLDSTVFHIQDQDCKCSSLSNNHVRLINQKVSQSAFSVKQLTPNTYQQLAAIVPAVPALVIFDRQGKLAYLGPYSSGYFCGVNTSLIEPIVETIVNNTHLGALVIADSEGCYCEI
ncbi:DUF6436 domain-containing protein [Paraglaciecola aestuariivivens]